MVFLLWFCCEAAGQAVQVKKSADVVVIRGKSYYLHTVQPGQTLYSIGKAYGVGVEELKALNDKKDHNLSLYEVLKVPYTEPYVEQDDKYYYYRVAKGETLYSIARRFGIKIKRLLKFNEEYAHDEKVPVGAVVRLPLKEIDLSAGEPGTVRQVENRPAPVVKTVRQTETKQPEREQPEVITEGNLSLRMEPLDTPREAGSGTDTVVPLPERTEPEMPAYLSEVVPTEDPFVKVAVLLPFAAREYPLVNDTLGGMPPVRISARTEQFVCFYEGLLLAADSLKNNGMKIRLYVYDTERSAEKMYALAEKLNLLKPDLIIGPVYGSVYKVLVENLQNKRIPVVYPLSSRSENSGIYPNFVQVNASYPVLVSKMAEWIGRQSVHANVIQLNLTGEDYYGDTAEKRLFTEKMKELEEVRFFDWNVAEVPLDTLRTLLLPDRENLLLFPTTKEADVSKVLPVLSALADGYPITVVGLPEWQTFTSVDHETYYKLNTKIFTYSYVDPESEAARQLAEKFRKYFYTEPHSLVYKAFDMGLYFFDLADKYRDRTLEALEYRPKDGDFSRFRFGRMDQGAGKENQGFFIVHFGSDYQLHIGKPEEIRQSSSEM